MKYLIFVSLLCLSGCGSMQVVTTPKEVKVPIAVTCDKPNITKPAMPFDEQAKKDMTTLQKAQLLAAQEQNQKGYIIELEAALNACTTLPVSK